jgi:hypothetical protein
MTQTFTQEHRAKLEEYLATHTLPSGVGTKESACSLAAINLALSGELTDEIPDCMSDVLGTAAMVLQVQCHLKCGIACDTKPYCLIWLALDANTNRNA